MPTFFRLLLLVSLVSMIAGCQSWWPWSDDEPATETQEDPSALALRAVIQNNLDKGQQALQTDRLTLPKKDCAVYYFEAVLAADPDNSEANAGLDSVVRRYMHLAAQAHDNGNDHQASSWLKRAEEVRGPTKKTTSMRSDLKKTPKGQNNREIAYLPANDYLLSREDLDARGSDIVKHLQGIARRAESRERAVLVVARDKAEGDWIVAIMNDAVPGYVLKTRIQIASRPAVILMSEKKLAESGSIDTVKSTGLTAGDVKKAAAKKTIVNNPAAKKSVVNKSPENNAVINKESQKPGATSVPVRSNWQ